MMSSNNQNVSAEMIVRKAAVAGQFYPAGANELRKEVLSYITENIPSLKSPRLMISPHAGFVFSGPVAGKGFATVNKETRRVFLIGPSHHAWFRGVSIPEVTHYQTPLGVVELDLDVIEKLRKNSFVCAAKGAHEQEHCLEVQLPFLQVQLKDFKIIPILTGEIDPAQVAELLYPFLDETTLVIASSDLSHYYPNKKARQIDDNTVQNILSGKIDGEIDGCGRTPIRVIMHLARKMMLKPHLLDARTSYETAPQYGSDSRVVGYASIIYSDKSGSEHLSSEISVLKAEHKSYLLRLARNSLNAAVQKKAVTDTAEMPEVLKDNRGCFVTLTSKGDLRGCIGYIEPIKPLYLAVMENAENAALKDPRFPPVTVNELSGIKVEVSVLTKPQPLEFSTPDELLKKLVPGVHGVILRKGFYQSTYLPQVWEQLPDKLKFLEQLSLKAGMPRDGWKTSEVRVYTAEHFSE
jgi:AmmeMemoRadiSam system protein B/AmmeMemoRadiSam system protein A